MGCAVQTTVPRGRAYTSLELKANFVKALTVKAGRIFAEGEVLTSGRRVATASGRVLGTDGTLYAHATTTCLIFEVPAVLDGSEIAASQGANARMPPLVVQHRRTTKRSVRDE